MCAATPWYAIVGVDGSRALEPIAALRAQGLHLEPRPHTSSQGPGVVLFGCCSPELRSFVHEASDGGLERVLAVALDPKAIHVDAAWELLAAGASDVIEWHHSPTAAADVAARFGRWTAVDELVASPVVQKNLAGTSRAWRAVLRQVVEVARFSQSQVLILGESGTGKELIARLIHALDQRHDKRDLVVLDCTTVVPELAGSEFFGHERGAFTGAMNARDGAFAMADGGTLFLDEIGDLPLPLQAQLLRAIQERTYKRVGGNSWHATRFRLLCATHRPLLDSVNAGTFRADLYYRISGVVCRVPPLRERPEDILELFRHFVAQASDRGLLPDLEDPVRQLLLARAYPGNVRELQQLARRTMCRHVGGGPITVGDVPDDERPPRGAAEPDRSALSFDVPIRLALSCGVGLKEIARLAASSAIRIAVGEANGNLQAAARRLGVTDRALQIRRAGATGRPSSDRTRAN
jgi:transcriptional regulator with GAF, ATPase, and Fis domain